MVIDGVGKAKVDEFNVAVPVQENIFQLEVSVNDAAGMQVGHRYDQIQTTHHRSAAQRCGQPRAH